MHITYGGACSGNEAAIDVMCPLASLCKRELCGNEGKSAVVW